MNRDGAHGTALRHWDFVTNMTTDKIVLSVIKKLNDRSEVGIKKYGTSLEDNHTDDMLVHLQEELMDAANYIEKLIQNRQ